MEEFLSNQSLSKYNKYILNKIIGRFEAGRDFNIYEMISESVSYKCILPSQNELIMDTYYCIKEYLVINGFLIENKEMTSYTATGKGLQLKQAGSIEKFEENEINKNKKSILQTLFSLSTYRTKSTALTKGVAEYL
jgi:hypothetical protein